MSSEFLSIPQRFNGPPTSGNGGYSCGIIANHIAGAARVRLHIPPPLDTPLALECNSDGSVALREDGILVANGAPCELQLDVPPAPGLDTARSARARFPCYEQHVFGTCFVCGPNRPEEDGLQLFPGPVGNWDLLACPWRPTADVLNEDGEVRPEIVWSALDCPGYFAAAGERLLHAVLGELEGERLAPVPGDQELVVYSWPLGEVGRKLYAGTAIATGDGVVLARARSTWILLDKR
ncbi:hypothetical protein F0M18_04325 [Pseudohalioglobus sediminis]|uniref:Uncharacterized protein n=1 Tax=Pseudohalioglobus sediminis TaxID=2606449 RepID=A0A5B0X378_9GAMM|nr:hypothetical protein [Pseudohalioglobus sediminis]KAA1193078.1 hypothetical protein F0M18_04325 [Pseudohalioglobus sediminis]